jgi:hypothetical protein
MLALLAGWARICVAAVSWGKPGQALSFETA